MELKGKTRRREKKIKHLGVCTADCEGFRWEYPHKDENLSWSNVARRCTFRPFLTCTLSASQLSFVTACQLTLYLLPVCGRTFQHQRGEIAWFIAPILHLREISIFHLPDHYLSIHFWCVISSFLSSCTEVVCFSVDLCGSVYLCVWANFPVQFWYSAGRHLSSEIPLFPQHVAQAGAICVLVCVGVCVCVCVCPSLRQSLYESSRLNFQFVAAFPVLFPGIKLKRDTLNYTSSH